MVEYIKIIKKKSKKGGGKDLNLDIIEDYIDNAFEQREKKKLKEYEKIYKSHLENPRTHKYSFNVGKKMVTRPSIKSQRYTQKKSKKLKTIEEEQKKNKNIDLG